MSVCYGRLMHITYTPRRMNLVVLGGYGEMGRVAVHHLLRTEAGDDITVVDAQERSLFDTDRVSYEHVNLDDRNAVTDLLEAFDCAANCAPFEYNLSITEAAISAETDIIDFGTYDSGIVEAQLDLHKEAEKKDVSVVPGIGASPGLTNVLIRDAADHLDSVTDVSIRWTSQRPLTASPGLLATALEEPLLERTQYIDGEWRTDSAPFTGAESVEFADWETITCYDVPHPEPITIPRFISDVNTVTVKGGWGESNELLRTVTELGLSRNKPVIQGITPREFITEFLVEALDQSVESRFSLAITATGLADGDEVEYRYDVPSIGEGDCEKYPFPVIPVAIPTGVPMAIGTAFLTDGQVIEPGVLPPEAAFDAGAFVKEARELIEICKSVEPAD